MKLKCPCGFEGDTFDDAFIEAETFCDMCGFHRVFKCPKCGNLYDSIHKVWIEV